MPRDLGGFDIGFDVRSSKIGWYSLRLGRNLDRGPSHGFGAEGGGLGVDGRLDLSHRLGVEGRLDLSRRLGAGGGGLGAEGRLDLSRRLAAEGRVGVGWRIGQAFLGFGLAGPRRHPGRRLVGERRRLILGRHCCSSPPDPPVTGADSSYSST